MNEKFYIACDLGAESGRVILGCLEDQKLTMEEIHRFSNGAVKVADTLRWDVARILAELKQGLKMVAERKLPVASVSVDSWGVDYALLDKDQQTLSQPFNYRDARTEKTYEPALETAGRELIFSETGIQFMSINTLYQLIAELETNPAGMNAAGSFLTIADYFNFCFSDVARAEASLASTTQIYNPRSQSWSQALIEKFRLPAHVFPEICASATRLGPLNATSQSDTGLPAIEVIATCSHDTGAAVAAVPAEIDSDWAYLSSGTWSLIGVELPEPLINESVRELNFTNEAGLGGTTRFLKNIVGLWILQESRRQWALDGQKLEYAEITKLAEQAEPFRSLINPDDERFLRPDAMPTKIGDFCEETGQPRPETPGQFARCILESLTLLYGDVLDNIEQLTDRKIKTLHIVGGGTNNSLLNQFAANATGRTVLAGPVEATAIGNLLIQAMALGDLKSHGELRDVVRRSFPIETYLPKDLPAWQQASQRFQTLRESK